MKRLLLISTAFLSWTVSHGQTDTTAKPHIDNCGFGLQGGPGSFFPTGSVRQKINQGTNFNPSLLINLKKVRLMLGVSELTASIKDNYNYRQEYKSGRYLKATSWELSTGYAVTGNNFVTVIPMLGIGFTDYELLNLDSLIPFDKTASYWTCSFRTAVDFNVFRAYTSDKTMFASIFIRAMAGYYPFIYKKPFNISGGAAFASISIGMQLGWVYRQTVNKSKAH